MAKNTKANTVTVTVTAGGKVTLADIKTLREQGVTATGHRSLELVTERAALVGITVVPTYTDNAAKALAEGKSLGLLRNAPKAPKGKKGGKKAKGTKASKPGLVDYVKADGTTVQVTAKQAAAWDAFKANRKVVQAPKGASKAKASATPEISDALIEALAAKLLARLS